MTYKTWETFLDQMNESKDTVVLDLTKEEKTSWQDKRINAMNKVIQKSGNPKALTEHFIDEYSNVCQSKAKNKMEYKKGL